MKKAKKVLEVEKKVVSLHSRFERTGPEPGSELAGRPVFFAPVAKGGKIIEKAEKKYRKYKQRELF